jgi:hypothetical protein
METVDSKPQLVKTRAKDYLRERGVLEKTFSSHGGEIDSSPHCVIIAERLERNFDKVCLDKAWDQVSSILWFSVPNFKGQHSHWLARPLPPPKKNKFLAANGSDSMPWIPRETWDVAKDVDVSLVITEGPVKGMVLIQAGAHPISLQGVWGMAAIKKKTRPEPGEDFEDQSNGGGGKDDGDDDGKLKLHGEIAHFQLWKRKVYLCFDADSSKNKNVRQAEIRTFFLLHSQGVDVYQLSWPLEEGKGIDDYLARKAGTDPKKQREAFAELIEKAVPFIQTLEQSDIPILKKELHRTQRDSAVFDELAGKIAKQIKTSKASLGKFKYGKEEDRQAAEGIAFESIEPWPEPVSLAEAFTETVELFRKWVFMSKTQAVAVVLWIATAFFARLLEIHAYLAITAPTKRCGKTTLFTLISLFVPQRLVVSSNVSSAFVFRVIDKNQPTLMVDEAQAAFQKNQDLEEIYNAGHVKRTAFVGRVEKVGEELVEKLFSTFCPKVLALKGKIKNDSLQDRVIEIRLERAAKSDLENDFWDTLSSQPEIFVPCVRRFVRAVTDSLDAFKAHRHPNLPEFSNGRTKQNWKPLWILAELAGDDWCGKLEDAIDECEEEAQRELSFTDYLLKALKRFCEAYQKRPGVLTRKLEQRDLIPTEEILSPTTGLNADKEAPWMTKSEGLTAERLGRELRGFPAVKKIQRRINVGQKPVRGYSCKALSKVFERYVK